jgi:cytochrome P450
VRTGKELHLGVSNLEESDTVSATLSFLCYELCKNPDVQAKLREVVDAIKPEKAHLDVCDVSDCAFLDGVVNEALRLHPAVRYNLAQSP